MLSVTTLIQTKAVLSVCVFNQTAGRLARCPGGTVTSLPIKNSDNANFILEDERNFHLLPKNSACNEYGNADVTSRSMADANKVRQRCFQSKRDGFPVAEDELGQGASLGELRR